MMDHSDPRRANRAQFELEGLGKGVIPRLLNKMYEVKPKGRDDVEALNRVVKLLRLMSGQAFNYNPMDIMGVVGANSKERESALKQWYAWWYKWHGTKRWNELVDREDEEFMTEEEVKAKRAAERKAAREERKKARKNKR